MALFSRLRHVSLNATITRYYLSFFMLIPMLVVVSAALGHSISLSLTGGMRELKLVAAVIVRPDYENIDNSDVSLAGGWVEILKDNKVVHILGEKKDGKSNYTDEELHKLSGGYDKRFVASYTDSNYYYSTAPFVGEDNNEYMCLVKIPLANLETSLRGVFNITNPEMRYARTILISMVLTVVIFCLLFFSSIRFYGRITAKKITGPLEAIGRGIKAITAGNLATRMDFDAEKEFADIRDAFNYMANRLQSAEKDKREMEANKQRLIMGISHDLKTPITTVYGYAKALNDGMVEDPERQKRHLQYIRDKALTMSRLIDDLFKYASIEGNAYALKKKPEDFAEFLRELIAENYIEIENRGFSLEIDISDEPATAPIDRAELYRALSNIIGNALKYNPPGTTLSVSLAVEPEHLRLTIEDDGIGISDEIKGTIFNEFVRGDAARVSDGGSGLGLAIARRIIEMHGGSISLLNGRVKGTGFVIMLPR